MAWGSVGCQEPGLILGGAWDTRASLTGGPLPPAEISAQALPWWGDWTEQAYPGSGTWSGVSQALGTGSLASLDGAARLRCTTPAGGPSPGSWPHAPAVATATSWDSPIALDIASGWSNNHLGGEPLADCNVSWGTANSDCTSSYWDSGLHTHGPTSSKGYPMSELPARNEPSRQSDRTASARYPKTNHRGEWCHW